jgi:YesN/AraC family two-component response regulator
MENTLQTIGIPQILALSPYIEEHSIGSDFILGEVSGRRVESNRAILDMLKYPVRLDGYVIFFLKKGDGSFQLGFNLDTYEIHERSLLITAPGNIIRLSAYDENKIADSELIFALLSKDFVSNIHVDFDKTLQAAVRFLESPCLTLNAEQLDIASDYFTLARKIIHSQMDNKREIISTLLTSITYLAVNLWRNDIASAMERQDMSSLRVNQTYEQFIALVSQHHNKERGMAFYADKMHITPKYLSKIIKQASGRSGPDWIDSFVVLEAKNLLKYTDKPVKEIVWQLNFPTPSVFNKFFKKHTNLTPSEYRKG